MKQELNLFRNYLIQTGKSQNTIRNYVSVIKNYLSFCQEATYSTVEQEAEEYLQRLKDGNCSAAVFNKAISALLLYLGDYKKLNLPILEDLERAKMSFSKDLYLPLADINLILDHEHDPTRKALLHLVAFAGIRPSEAAALEVKDFRQGNSLFVGKNTKYEREVQLDIPMAFFLKNYIRKSAPKLFIFEKARNSHGCYSKRAVQSFFKKAKKKAGVVSNAKLFDSFIIQRIKEEEAVADRDVRILAYTGIKKLRNLDRHYKFALDPWFTL